MFPPTFPDDGSWRPAPGLYHAPDDLMLAIAVVDRLVADPELVGAEIEVAVQNRVVMLGGHAPSHEIRIHCGDSAWRVSGVFDVCNLIRVRA